MYGGNRRVPGLRRGEVAMLAGVSVEYYTRLERGNLSGVSEGVLEALARALQLDEAEQAHLFDLARAASTSRRPQRSRPTIQPVRASVQLVLDAMTNAPAFVRNGRLDVLAANQLGYALYSEMYASPVRPANHARFIFLDNRSYGFYPDWERAANDTVAILRTEAGRDPYDRGLTDLVGELSTRSEEFRTRWAAHNVRQHHTGSSTSGTPWSGTSTSCTRAWNSPPTPGCRCLFIPPSPVLPPGTRCGCWPAGTRTAISAHPIRASTAPALTGPSRGVRSWSSGAPRGFPAYRAFGPLLARTTSRAG